MIERNQQWADVLRAELRGIWDGYEPDLTQQILDREGQVAERGYSTPYTARTMDELEARRAAVRAARDGKNGGAPSYGAGAAEGTNVPTTA